MKTVQITTQKSYNVLIDTQLHRRTGEFLKEIIPPCTAAIISDSNVWPLFGSTVAKSLEAAGYRTVHFIFPAGEGSKTAATYLDILNFLAENRVTRTDCLLALGGGVVGDISGFAAATYLRGIPYIQLPTSLLAMVDSSVGGKTAIDLPAGKNLAGAFCQPSLVLCDLDALNTLPESIFRDGCAEVIKYGVLYDPELFSHLLSKGLSFDREAVISRCVALKRDVVAEDEFDRGQRQKLNLGHTFGHSIEALSNFTVTHGQAVAIGMNLVASASAALGICDRETCAKIRQITAVFGLPVTTDRTPLEISDIALSDKKRAGDSITLIVPEFIGSCLLYPVPVTRLTSFIEVGLT